MLKRTLFFIAVLGALGWLGLSFLKWQFGVGEHVASPQRVVLDTGRGMIVGGGKALLGLTIHTRDRVILNLSCAGEKREIELREAAVSDEVCGVRVRWLGQAPTGQDGAVLDVIWDEPASNPTPDAVE